MSQKHMKSDARREEILRSALRLATDAGYHSVDLKSVAKTAGCSTALVMLYYPTMDLLRTRVMELAVAERILPVIGQGLAIGHPVAKAAPSELRINAAVSLGV